MTEDDPHRLLPDELREALTEEANEETPATESLRELRMGDKLQWDRMLN